MPGARAPLLPLLQLVLTAIFSARGESVVSYAVQPQTGLALVFDHGALLPLLRLLPLALLFTVCVAAILHEGELLKSGEKYIMRCAASRQSAV